jgi:hypothetical protein
MGAKVSVSGPIRREFVVRLRERDLERPAGALAGLLTAAIPADGDTVSQWEQVFLM